MDAILERCKMSSKSDYHEQNYTLTAKIFVPPEEKQVGEKFDVNSEKKEFPQILKIGQNMKSIIYKFLNCNSDTKNVPFAMKKYDFL